MHLHRGYGDANIVGNLFVKATGHDMEHDFTLAGTKTFETLLQPSQSSITLPSSAIASKSGLDGLNEVLITEWFPGRATHVRRIRLDGWHFSGDAVQFPQGGERPRPRGARKARLPNSTRKPDAGV